MGYIAAPRDTRGVPRVCGWVPGIHPTFHANCAPHSYRPFPLFSSCNVFLPEHTYRAWHDPYTAEWRQKVLRPIGCATPRRVGGFIPFGQGPEATDIGHPALSLTKQLEAVKQYNASFLFPVPDLLGLLMDLNIPKVDFRAVSVYMSCPGVAYTAATGYPFPRPIPSHDQFSDTWKEMAKPLELQPRVSVVYPPACGRSWPLQSWARYVQ